MLQCELKRCQGCHYLESKPPAEELSDNQNLKLLH